MLRNQVNESFIVDDMNAFDQRRVTQAPGRYVGTKYVKRKVFHPRGYGFGV